MSPFLGDDGFLGITALAPTLTSLSLQGDGRLTPNGITALAQLTGLHSLALAWCSARVASRALLPLISFKLSQVHLWLSALHAHPLCHSDGPPGRPVSCCWDSSSAPLKLRALEPPPVGGGSGGAHENVGCQVQALLLVPGAH